MTGCLKTNQRWTRPSCSILCIHRKPSQGEIWTGTQGSLWLSSHKVKWPNSKRNKISYVTNFNLTSRKMKRIKKTNNPLLKLKAKITMKICYLASGSKEFKAQSTRFGSTLPFKGWRMRKRKKRWRDKPGWSAIGSLNQLCPKLRRAEVSPILWATDQSRRRKTALFQNECGRPWSQNTTP